MVFAFGTVTFVLLEGWCVSDAMYFCMITSTTVGYGDHLDFEANKSKVTFSGMFSKPSGAGLTSDTSKLAACVYIIFSVDCMGLLLSRVGDKVMRLLESAGITTKPK